MYFLTDYYNASAESISASFEYAKNTATGGKKHLLLGDVLELGRLSRDIHYDIGKSIPHDLFTNLFLFGDFSEIVKQGAIDSGFEEKRIHTNLDLNYPEITANQIKKHCNDDDIILMKASRAVRLERVLDFFI
jgi:UDP-N-acetylmuramoyl-tripeptide--D-alanyl-D-alanine ligase